MLRQISQLLLRSLYNTLGEPERDMTVSARLSDNVFTETHGLENLCSARALENADLKRVMSAAVSIATLTWHDLALNMQDEQFLVPMANLIFFSSEILLYFAGIFGQKIGYIRSKKYVHLNAVITLSNNTQNKYSNSIYKIY